MDAYAVPLDLPHGLDTKVSNPSALIPLPPSGGGFEVVVSVNHPHTFFLVPVGRHISFLPPR